MDRVESPVKVLITGGTGSLGRALVSAFLTADAKRIVVYSRDEVKQAELARTLPGRFPDNEQVRFFLGDVRDFPRLTEAMRGIDVVVHAAALKRIDWVSYNPSEVLQTNIIGTRNVLRAATAEHVGRVLFISSDKAVHPANVYGATKLVGEFLTIRHNVVSAPTGTRSSVLRYGNVWGSRGSVIEAFRAALVAGTPLQVTNPKMTRFFLTLPMATDYVTHALELMESGEVFVPKLSAWLLDQVARMFAPREEWALIGHRPGGEKLHEQLIADSEMIRVTEMLPFYIIRPDPHEWRTRHWLDDHAPVDLGTYSSDTVPQVSGDVLRAALIEAVARFTSSARGSANAPGTTAEARGDR